MITRRCTQRQFLLRPSDIVNQIFLYTLAYVAKKYSIKVHSDGYDVNHLVLGSSPSGGAKIKAPRMRCL